MTATEEARMLINKKRRWRAPALAVSALVLGAPAPTFAQQSGLFPNATIRRVRPSCDQQDPIYKHYRDHYYGYHPTCWRRFPDGWGCPSPEGPDRARSFQEIPKKPPAPLGDFDLGEEDATGRDGEMNRPPDREQRSPFELPAVPENNQPLFPPNDADQGGAPGAAPGNPPQADQRPALPDAAAPDLAAPAGRPEAGRTTSSRARDRIRDDFDNRPILAMSEELAVDPAGPPDEPPALDRGAAAPPVEKPAAAARPSRPPARQGVLSGLFGGNGWILRRR